MKSTLSLLLLALGLTASVASAQVTYTGPFYDTFHNVNGAGKTVGQTFTGFTDVYDMQWYIQNPTGASATTTFGTYLAEWNTTTNRPVTGTFVQFQTSTVTIIAGAGGPYSFTPVSPVSIDPSKTYIALLSYNSGDSTLQAGSGADVSSPGDFFYSGNGVTFGTTSASGGFAAFSAALPVATRSLLPTDDFSFVITATPFVAPIPEPKTAAAALSAVFVAGLALRRQRRSVAPVAA
jgi:hypothetical protein